MLNTKVAIEIDRYLKMNDEISWLNCQLNDACVEIDSLTRVIQVLISSVDSDDKLKVLHSLFGVVDEETFEWVLALMEE